MGLYADRVRETTQTSGTGNVTLGGTRAGFRTFNAAFGLNVRFYYCIAAGAEWEVGEGFLTDATTLVRDDVLSSSNANALVNFAAGVTKDVFCTMPASEGQDKSVSHAMRLNLNLGY